MPTSRHSAKHRRPAHRRPSGRVRQGPARLTLAVAAATTAVVGAAATGVALAAGPADGPSGVHRVDAATAARPAVGLAVQAGASGRTAAKGATRQAEPPRTATPSPGVTPQAKPSPTPTHPSTSAAPTQPYLVYDSVVPSALPTGHTIAVYATGGRPAQPSELAGRGPVLWIDVVGTDPAADVLDVEPGCVGPSAIPGWVTQRLTAHPGALAIIYTTISEWAAAQAEVASLPTAMRAQVRWWIADPTGYAHVVPGSDATQWYWGSSYDISTATPRL